MEGNQTKFDLKISYADFLSIDSITWFKNKFNIEKSRLVCSSLVNKEIYSSFINFKSEEDDFIYGGIIFYRNLEKKFF